MMNSKNNSIISKIKFYVSITFSLFLFTILFVLLLINLPYPMATVYKFSVYSTLNTMEGVASCVHLFTDDEYSELLKENEDYLEDGLVELKSINISDYKLVKKNDSYALVKVKMAVKFKTFGETVKSDYEGELYLRCQKVLGIKRWYLTSLPKFSSGVVKNDIYKSIVKIDYGFNDIVNEWSVPVNQKIRVPDVVLREGYAFLGWYEDDKLFDFGTEIKKDTVLQAKWIEKDKMNFSYTIENNQCIIKSIDDKKVTSIKINDNYDGAKVQTINARLFQNMQNLVTIELPKTIAEIKDNAFDLCDKLSTVYFGGTIEDWCLIKFSGEKSNPLYYAKTLYVKDENDEYALVSEINIKDTISRIEDYAFINYKRLTSVNIQGVEYIGFSSFKGCSGIKRIMLPFVGEGVLSNNYWFGYIFGADDYLNNGEFVPKEINEVVILDTEVTLRNFAFYNCAQLKKIYLPDNIESMGYFVFGGCSELTIYFETNKGMKNWQMNWNPLSRPILYKNNSQR